MATESLRAWVERWGLLSHAGPLESRFLKGAFWLVGGTIIAQALSMLASFVTARLLGRVGVGEVGIVISTLGAFGIFAGFGLGLTAT